MDILILPLVIFILWTFEMLFGVKFFQPPKPPPSKEEKLADALAKYLEEGVKIREASGKD